jgi:selenocysteine-specific elongation factor
VRVIGTAGHVDHGKSALVEALTGTHPDRLKEEQEREMTIELGFAWWQLPNGEEVGVVDVPGHRDFIENMLSGVGGIDAALFVVAADEGVMPQTREHLAILDILQVNAGVVALTKIDLVTDDDWLDFVEEEVRQELVGTVLEHAPLVRVSAKEKINISELHQVIAGVLEQHPKRLDLGRPRLPIDRVFTMSGFGTVVTGTLVDGSFSVGDEVSILPPGLSGRVRGLQTHKRKTEQAFPGSRTAMNISGVDLADLARGQVVVQPNSIQPTRRLDLYFKLLSDVALPIEHNSEVKLFIGATEMVARLRLIGKKQLLPGEEGWLQLEPRDPIVAVRGDRYILRRPSPGETLGGGVVLDAHPKGRHKRFSDEVLSRLQALTEGNPEEVFFQALLTSGVAPYLAVLQTSNLDRAIADQAAEILLESGQLVILNSGEKKLKDKTWVTSYSFWEQASQRCLTITAQYHKNFPLRLGIPLGELQSRLSVEPRLFTALTSRLVEDSQLVIQGAFARLPDHRIEFSPEQQSQVDALLARFATAPFTPPTIKECIGEIGDDLYQTLVALGNLLPLSAEVVFRPEDYQQAVTDLRSLVVQHGTVTLAQARDHWGTTRRYAQSLLEYMDQQAVTVRVGDARKLKS